MKQILALGAVLGTLAALRAVSRRLATHRTPLPSVTTRVHTRVTRINQP
ncbi:hypothetical protein [Nocardioides sp. BYT-33-1]